MTTQSSDTLHVGFDTWKTQLEKHKQECGVAQMTTPGTAKDSRESLHDTSNATDSVKNWRTFWKDVLNENDPGAHVYPESELTEAINQQKTMAKQKAVDDFLDTICCALEELSGEEVFDCFVEAVQSQWDYTRKEHEKTNDLFKRVLGDSK
jgi:hypothetical protein